MKVKVDVLGRLGTFGLSVMKTKADRMWEEFGQNLVARLEGGPPVAAAAPAPVTQVAAPASVAVAARPAPAVAAPAPDATPPAAASAAPVAAGRGWWSRLVKGSAADGRHIRIELQRGDTLLKVDWPVEAAADCSAWLRDVTK
jgi:pyruvate/2-oxoglutarate dehydrogenase complex dihydrolipoamide acyltransferase (E2) component